jgi:SAM-dependent methyltransferase
MEDRDKDNITFSHTLSSISSERGKKFNYEKFIPKIDIIKEHFKIDWQDKYILDIGVGYGNFLRLLEELNFKRLFGMDPFIKSIKISKQFTSADLRQGKIEDKTWPFKEKMFDVITCFDVVEHLQNPKLFFINSKKYLKYDGIIIVTTPNKQLPYRMRSLPWIGIPDTNPTHINIQKPAYWIELAEEVGYNIQNMWKGEHLTHIKHIPSILKKITRVLNLDPKNVPIVNAFEQSFCMLLEHKVDFNSNHT